MLNAPVIGAVDLASNLLYDAMTVVRCSNPGDWSRSSAR